MNWKPMNALKGKSLLILKRDPFRLFCVATIAAKHGVINVANVDFNHPCDEGMKSNGVLSSIHIVDRHCENLSI